MNWVRWCLLYRAMQQHARYIFDLYVTCPIVGNFLFSIWVPACIHKLLRTNRCKNCYFSLSNNPESRSNLECLSSTSDKRIAHMLAQRPRAENKRFLDMSSYAGTGGSVWAPGFTRVRVRWVPAGSEGGGGGSGGGAGGRAAISKRCGRAGEVSRRTAARSQRCYPLPSGVSPPAPARTRLSHTNTGDLRLRNSTPNRKVVAIGI